MERVETPLWNKIALREAVINAIVHNDYSFDISTYNSKERSIVFSQDIQEYDGYYHADYKLIHNSNPAEPDTVIELYVESYSIYDKENDRNSYYDAYEDDPSAEWR